MFLVDQVSRSIDIRLRWISRNQQNFFQPGNNVTISNSRGNGRSSDNHSSDGGSEDEASDNLPPADDVSSIGSIYNGSENHEVEHVATVEAADDDIEETVLEKKTYLPSSVFGSPRHLRKLARNALAIVSELGKPTFFITLTCNPNWPEITTQLLLGQTAFDRPDIVCMVFKAKLTVFLTNLRNGHYFGYDHKVVYLMHVIEYQHRGLPHAHITVKLSNVPDDDLLRRQLQHQERDRLLRDTTATIDLPPPPLTQEQQRDLNEAVCVFIDKHIRAELITSEELDNNNNNVSYKSR